MTPLINFHFSHQIIRNAQNQKDIMNLKCNFDLLKCNKTKRICAMLVLILFVILSLDLQMAVIIATQFHGQGGSSAYYSHFTTDVDEYVKKIFY